MTQKEIAVHLFSEVTSNRKRIVSKVRSVAKRMQKVGRKVHAYQQTIGSNTRLMIYIYGIDKGGVDYAVGCWYHSEKGLCWASVGQNDVNFYIAHFFHRYAERFLKKEVSVLDSAMEFYRQYQVSAIRRIKKRNDGLYEIQTPLQGGLGLGVNDVSNGVVIYNTCITQEMLREDQIGNIEDDKELNEAIQSMSWLKYRTMVDALKPPKS
jgi:hypothetical protein